MQFPKMTSHTVCLFQWLWYQKQSASDYNGDLLKQWWQKGRADDVENNMHTSQQKSDKSDTTAGMGLVTTTEPDCLPAEVLTVVSEGKTVSWCQKQYAQYCPEML